MARMKWILTVDDDPAILDLLEGALAHPDLRITSAGDAMQAFIQARDIAPILIISDIQMPGYGDGTKTLKLLREDPLIPRVPIVFMTGMDLNKARELLPPNDPTIGLIAKPLDLDQLRDYVWRLAGITAAAPAVQSLLTDFLSRKVHQLLIDGRREDAASGKTFATLNRAGGGTLGTVAEADCVDIDRAVAAARGALAGPWSKMSPAARQEVLRKAADLLEARAQHFAELAALDGGKPVQEAISVELPSAIGLLRCCGGGPGARGSAGATGIVIAGDDPLLAAVERLAPALARGGAVVIKPSARAPLSALWLGELLLEAGVPAGVVNVAPGFGPTAGAALSRHAGIDTVSFAGSSAAGREVAAGSAGGFNRMSLDLYRD